MRQRVPMQWVMKQAEPILAERLARECRLHPVTAQILVNRGVRDAESADRFLNPSLTHLEEPTSLADIDRAATRIREAVAARQKVLVFGDYDVDGITASSLLYRFLRLSGAECEVYLPNRLEEGYGLSDAAAEEIAGRAPALVITVDCGIRSAEQVDRLQSAGIDVIVTDHHEPGAELPRAYAVINPRRSDCAYPFKDLAGVGVAFKLAWACATRFSLSKRVSAAHRKFLLDAVAFVALGTVADVAPLLGENRVLVGHGLRVLASCSHPGLRSLIEVSRLSGALSASDLAFRLGPRINAAGRTGSPADALALFLEDDAARAHDIAERLDRKNRERQRTEAKVLLDALRDPEAERADRSTMVLASDTWHQGVLGIVASRLAERTSKVAVLVSFRGDEGRGSARTTSGVDVGAALERCSGHLVQCGGHAAAAGLQMQRSQLDGFRAAFESAVDAQLGGRQPTAVLTCEAEVAPDDLTLALAMEIDRLEPFGKANERPVFAMRGVELGGQLRPLGAEGKHYSFQAVGGERTFRAVAFNFDTRRDELETLAWRKVDLAFELRRSEYSGPAGFELCVKDIRAATRGGLRKAAGAESSQPQ